MRKSKLDEIQSYINELKVIKKEIYNVQKKFIETLGYKLSLNNGRILTRERLLKGGLDGSAVIVVPVKTNGEIIINIEPRVFTKETVGVGFPAGYIEQNESPKQAAERELQEETGCKFNTLTHLDSFYQDEGISSAYNHIFIAEGCRKQTDQHLDEDEIIRFTSVTLEELLELEQIGLINSSNTKLALLRANNYLNKRR